MSTGAPTVRSLDNRVDDIEKEFLAFQARMDVIVSLLKWIAGFSLASVLAVVIQLLSISFYAGNLKEKVDSQGITLGKLQDKIETQGTAIQEMKSDLRESKKEMVAVRETLQEMRTELREMRKELTQIREELKKPRKDPGE